MPFWTAIALIFGAASVSFVIGAMLGSSKRESADHDEREKHPIRLIEENNVFSIYRGDRP